MAVLPSTSRLLAISVNIIHPETAVAGRGAETLSSIGFWCSQAAVRARARARRFCTRLR